nr:ThiS [Madagascaria erythrocladioides]
MNIYSQTKQNKITIQVNGESFNCISPISISNLIEYLDFNSNTVIVEHNLKVVSKDKLPYIELNDKDKLEIVTIVGGG